MIENDLITDFDAVIDARFGAEGTPERMKAEEDAIAFFTAQILRDTRREAKMTQAELAQKLGSTKSYISRIENGLITPSVATFYRIINALGMRVEIVKPL